MLHWALCVHGVQIQEEVNCELVRHSPCECLHDSLKTGNHSGVKAKTSTTTTGQPKTDLPRRSRRGHSSPHLFANKIQETDPYRIKRLWREVMAPKTPSYSGPTTSSKLEDTATNQSPSGSFTAPTSVTASTKKQTVKNATVRDADFEDTQLIPRGIEICRTSDLSLGSVGGAHAYFGSEAPSNSAREFYRSILQKSFAGRVERDIDDGIFLSVDADFVQSVHRAYRSLGEAKVPGHEFKLCACQHLFIGKYVILANDARRQLCAVRAAEWSLKPHESDLHPWCAPPLLSGNHSPLKPFDFDIYSDCQFWLSNEILNADYRENISHLVHCKAFGAFCPYISIEFKATTDDTRVVENQVAAAGSISLFNRCLLKLDAYPHPTPEQLNLVRHYGLTMEKDKWTAWLFEPKIADDSWAGCKTRKLDGGTCLTEQGVRRLLSWINEIHRWGLCEYALGCEEDIKHILSRASIHLRVSAIGS